MRGDYLACSSSAWSERRREELRSKANQARSEAAELAYQFGRYAQADTLLRVLLFDDPLREEAWRLRLRLDHALADFDAVLKTYRSCQESLATIGLEPAPSTRRLVEELRA
jgi:two-component SAPR family response regulator